MNRRMQDFLLRDYRAIFEVPLLSTGPVGPVEVDGRGEEHKQEKYP